MFPVRGGRQRRGVPARLVLLLGKGGAVVEPGCAIERLGVDLRDPQLARYLLDLRLELESARDAEAARAALERLTELAPPDMSGA